MAITAVPMTKVQVINLNRRSGMKNSKSSVFPWLLN